MTPFAARPLLRIALHGFDVLSIGIAAGSFLAVVAIARGEGLDERFLPTLPG